MYLSRILKPLDLALSQIAYGIPMGGELEWVDEMTLGRAFDGRREL
jgi:recombination protein RecR